MQIVEGMSAVVTGAGGGMGRSIALALADEGVNVVVADIDADAAASVSEEVAARGVNSIAVATDVAKLDAVEALADRAYDEFGSVEILCNNAGVTLRPFRASWDTSHEDFEWVLNINLWGVLNGHSAFVPRMLATPGAKHIVNTSSLATVLNAPGHSAYNASKAAVDAFSITARKELADSNIGVTLLHPGAVRTRIATSERLRPPAEQSETRHVKPWSEYERRKGENPIAEKAGDVQPVEDPDTADDVFTYITPNATGWLVLEAIRNNKQHILTHPVSTDVAQARTDAILDGLPNYTEFLQVAKNAITR